MAVDTNHNNGPDEPVGIGGWLLLPILGLLVSLVDSARVLWTTTFVILGPKMWSAYLNPNTVFYHSGWVPVMIIGGLMQFFLAVLSVIALISIFLKKRYVPRLMIGVYVLAFCLAVLDVALIYQFFTTINRSWAHHMEPAVIRKFLITSGIVVVWVPYFIKSKRVNNTFVR